MLRPSNSLLDSSRAARRANSRAEHLKTLRHLFRLLKMLVVGVLRTVLGLLVLCAHPLLYLISAYLVLDVPAHWLTHRDVWGGWGVLAFVIAVAVGLTGISRAVRNAPPVAPVRPKFAKVMFGLSWVVALLLTLGDLAS